MRRRQRRILEDDAGREVEEELAFHLEERVREYMARGMDEAAARAAARRRLGDLAAVRSECVELVEVDRRSRRLRGYWEDLRRDVALGARGSLRTPLFTVVTILMLALGIGVNAAVFGVLKAVLLDGLPYDRPERLVRVWGVSREGDRVPLSRGAYADHVERQQSFERTGAYYRSPYEVIHRPPEGPRVAMAALVEPGFFETLGIRPAVGRLFTRDEVEGGTPVIMVSYATWVRVFGADRGLVGRTVRIDADAWQVVGVLPQGFVGPFGEAEFWFGLRSWSGAGDPVLARSVRSLGYIARLRDGVSIDAARRELDDISRQLGTEHPQTDVGYGVAVHTIRASLAGDARTPLLVLMASAALVLLITCANLASALLSRSLTRRQEFAVRRALGAGRSRLIRQLLAESALLTLAGALAGLLLAAGGLAVLRAFAPPIIPQYADLSLDAGVILVISVITLITGLSVGAAPAFAARDTRGEESLRDGPRGSGENRRSRRLRGILAAAQVALCASLLMGAALLGRSLEAMTQAPLGYDPANVAAISVKGPIPAPDAARRAFFQQLLERADAMPGARGSAFANQLPSSSTVRDNVVVETASQTAPPALLPVTTVSDAYFEVMRIPLLAGRAFGATETMGGPTAVIVSRAFALRFPPGTEAIGSRIRVGGADSEWGVIVGVVGDVRTDPGRPVAEATVYLSARQSPLRMSQFYFLRAETNALALLRPLRQALSELDPGVPMDEIGPLIRLVDSGLDSRRLPTFVLGSFALLALLLAAVGVYSLFASLANARQREFGVRMALGSSSRTIALLVLRQGGAWALLGLAGGMVGIAITGRALRGLLFEVAPLDPVAIAASIAILTAVATLAMLGPVRRAARTNAVDILRQGS